MTGLVSITPRRAIPQILDELQAKKSVMLWGPPGCGKSDIGRQIAKIGFDDILIDCRLSHHDPSDFHIPMVDVHNKKKIAEWWPTDLLPFEGSDFPERGLILLDEITSALPGQAIIGYQLTQDRALGRSRIKSGWGIMAAGNRQGDRGIVYTMSSPQANRFQHFEFNPADPAVRAEWVIDFAYYAAEHGLNPIVSSFVQFCPDLLYQMPKSGEVAFPTLRSWTNLAESMDRAEARKENIEPETVIGRIGNAAAQSFLAYTKHKDDVPVFEEIVADPTGARCPTAKKLGACFFVVGMLCHKMTGANFAQCSKYLQRLPDEIDAAAVGMMKESVRRDVLMSRAGQAWLCRVQSLLA